MAEEALQALESPATFSPSWTSPSKSLASNCPMAKLSTKIDGRVAYLILLNFALYYAIQTAIIFFARTDYGILELKLHNRVTTYGIFW